ncbi:mpv17-like protein [Drosophila tropicalis]|uniref:mpv17-like protein n=1 Tax=Drosophila tropicalis TaxID=46794 RepID=UPI0035ABDF6A
MSLRAYVKESVNVAIIMGAGDMIGQFLIEKRSLKNWDAARTARFSALGMVVIGPALKKWYGTLDGFVSKDQSHLKRGVKKMLMDQLLFAPPFSLAITFLVPFINGEKTDKIVERIKSDYFDILQKNYMLWPAAQVINFSFVPTQYQVIYAQLVAILWNCYLSVMLNKN